MINEILLSPKDVEINKLKLTIKKFKEYDKKRKKYYKDSLQKLGELESYVLELEETSKDLKSKNSLRKELKTYKDLYDHQVLINDTLRKKEELIPELIQLNFYKEKCSKLEKTIEDLKLNLSKANKKIDSLKKDISNLICKLCKNDTSI